MPFSTILKTIKPTNTQGKPFERKLKLTSKYFRDSLVEFLTKEEIKKGQILKTEYNFRKLREKKNKEKNDCLHIACEKGNDKVVDIIMGTGYEVGVLNKQRMNALHVAVKEKHLKCVKVILSYTSKKADIIKAKDIHEEDAIMIGIKKRQKEIVDALLNEHTNFGFKENDKKELMNYCAEFGNVDIMESVYNAVQSSQLPKSLVDESLHFAIKSNQEDLLHATPRTTTVPSALRWAVLARPSAAFLAIWSLSPFVIAVFRRSANSRRTTTF